MALFEIGVYPIAALILAGLFTWQVINTQHMINDLAERKVKRDELRNRLVQYKANIIIASLK